MQKKQNDPKAGFTLIELLVVVAIIGILTGLTLGIANLAQQKSTNSKAISEMQSLSNFLEEHRILQGRYPEELDELINNDAVLPEYVIVEIATDFSDTDIDPENVPKTLPWNDPWGSSYVYTNLSRYAFSLKSTGRDRTLGTEDDIINGK